MQAPSEGQTALGEVGVGTSSTHPEVSASGMAKPTFPLGLQASGGKSAQALLQW